MTYVSSPESRHGTGRIGVLLINSGTPESLSTRDVRRFLRGLLSDPRVVELPRVLWLPILYGFILPLRPRASKRKYARIWTEQGSPMTKYSNELVTALNALLPTQMPQAPSIELGMLYAQPSIRNALARLQFAGAERILVLPLFPQYCGASSGAAFDRVAAVLRRWRWLPDMHFIAGYHGDPGYIDALAQSVETAWRTQGRTQHLLISFHGIPLEFSKNGDPYFENCQSTARLLAAKLALDEGQWSVSFQSKFGPGRWLAPYTAEVVAQMPRRGIEELSVICPGFSIDCLETLEEIAIENRDCFLAAGGRRFHYVPALNADGAHVSALAALITRHTQGWRSADARPLS